MAQPEQGLLFPDASAPTLRAVADAVRLGGVEGLTSAVLLADEARYQEVTVRSALTRPRGMPFRWALNPYRGCTHACEYCYARKYQGHLDLGRGDDFSQLILVKRNIADLLRREVTRAGWNAERVAVGTATDPYQPAEGRYRLTRRCLETLVLHDTPFTLVTKGPLVVRDVDVFLEATRRAGGQVVMSVASVDEQVWHKLAPGTAPPAQRLKAIAALARAGVDASVLMMPLLPGISTAAGAIERTVRAIADTGARLLGANVGHFETGVREHFFAVLGREYPDLVEGYARLYGRGYAPAGYGSAVKQLVRRACRRASEIRPDSEARAAQPRAARSGDASRRAPSFPPPKTAS